MKQIKRLLSCMLLVLMVLGLFAEGSWAAQQTLSAVSGTVSISGASKGQKISLCKKKKKSSKSKETKPETEKKETSEKTTEKKEDSEKEEQVKVEKKGCYTSKEEVAAYLHEFGTLPSNFITKKEAKRLGWVSSEGNLGTVAPGKSIGGDYFGNYEEILPVVKGRDYYECDIDSTGGYRGAKRIIYSNDGWIYYTEDHYKSFDLMYEGD